MKTKQSGLSAASRYPGLVLLIVTASLAVAVAALARPGGAADTDSRAASADAPASVPASAEPGPGFDVKLFRILNGSLINPFFDFLMPMVTDLNRWRIIILLVWAALVFFGGSKGRWAAFMLIPLIAASDQLSSNLIKPLVHRMRPCEVLGSVHFWHGPTGWMTTPAEVTQSYKASFSFPSSHATNITAAMLFLGLVYRKAIIPLLVMAAMVSFSRIYIGVHWPLDVAAGAAIGTLLAWPAYIVFKKISRTGVTEADDSDEQPPTQQIPDRPLSG